MDATGVKVYILDTGIQKDNVDFTTPLDMIDDTSNCHVDTSGDNGSPFNDGNGHGTHVASTTCGNKYGVASNCNLCAVKVLRSSGSGTTSGVIAGIDHAAANCNGARCVANMSLGGGFSSSLNNAVANAVAAGVTMVVAAGNDNQDACNYSPASEPSAITVGSTTSTDARSSFSNKGAQCLDVFAPGSGITAAWIGSNTATNTISGTSMASPHVAGIAAGILGSSASNMSPAEVLNTILLQSKSDIISDHQSPGIPLATTTYCNVPTVSPAPTPTPPNLEVEILTDNYPGETTWTLTSDCGGESISGGTYSGQGVTYKSGIFNASGQYTFSISDSYGDGICCRYGSGSYKVMMDGVMMAEGGAFGASATHTFGTCPTGPTNPPTMKPTSPPTTSPTPSPTKQPVVGPDCGSATDRRSCNRIDGCDWDGRFKTCILA
jgi:serine protease